MVEMVDGRPRRRWVNRTMLVLFLYLGASLLWQSLSTSASYGAQSPWVTTDSLAYSFWGAMAGAFVVFPLLWGWYTFRVAPLRPEGVPVVSIRSRPGASFVLGLAVGVEVWTVALVVGLVLTGTQLPWPLVYGLGFVAGLVVLAAIGYAAFLAFPYPRPVRSSVP